MQPLTDSFGRVHDYLRISLTDRCNLNCLYCNPLNESMSYKRADNLLDAEQFGRIVRIFLNYFGFRKIRLTGGEPLVRKNIDSILDKIKKLKETNDFELSITTNGTLLDQKLESLLIAGVDSINISLDTLREDTFKKLAGHSNLKGIIEAIDKALTVSTLKVKINCVVLKGINDNEILDFIAFFANKNVSLRFIEYMPFTDNKWNETSFLSYKEIKEKIETEYKLHPLEGGKNSVSRDYSADGLKCTLGFISSISEHFCSTCNRIRITADGNLRLCLFGTKETELNLKHLLEDPAYSDENIAEHISAHMKLKSFEHPPVEELTKMDFNYMLKAGG
jgi:cyclic pyranopterin phosphate synthase